MGADELGDIIDEDEFLEYKSPLAMRKIAAAISQKHEHSSIEEFIIHIASKHWMLFLNDSNDIFESHMLPKSDISELMSLTKQERVDLLPYLTRYNMEEIQVLKPLNESLAKILSNLQHCLFKFQNSCRDKFTDNFNKHPEFQGKMFKEFEAKKGTQGKHKLECFYPDLVELSYFEKTSPDLPLPPPAFSLFPKDVQTFPDFEFICYGFLETTELEIHSNIFQNINWWEYMTRCYPDPTLKRITLREEYTSQNTLMKSRSPERVVIQPGDILVMHIDCMFRIVDSGYYKSSEWKNRVFALVSYCGYNQPKTAVPFLSLESLYSRSVRRSAYWLTKEKKTILHEFCNNFFVDFSNRAINFDEDTRSRRSSSSANVAQPFTNDVNDAASALLLVSRLNDKSSCSRAKPRTNLNSKKKASKDAEPQSSKESEAPPMPLTSRDAEQQNIMQASSNAEQSTESEAPTRDTAEQSTESEAPMQQHSIIQKKTKNKMLVRGGITTMRLKN
jgi:hypothetical protein